MRIYRTRYARLRQEFARDLGKIAAYCSEHGLGKEASGLRRLAAAAVRTETGDRFSRLPRKVLPEVPRDLPDAQRQWRLQLRKARATLANGLYRISRDAINAGFPSYAYAMVRETVRYDADHVSGRRLLGYVRMGDAWVTPFEKKQAQKRKVWHDRFGWLPKDHVRKYEAGMRFSRGRWVPKARDEAEHRDFDKNPWRIQTEHFLVKTNHSLEEGVRVAKRLEDYYQYFFQIYTGFFNSRQQIRKLFAGGFATKNVRMQLYKVNYYRSKDEYVNRLKRQFPTIAGTNGLYLPADRRCHFFHAKGNTPTLYHEATHQFFYESIKRQRLIAGREHFWIIEGISCYMESFQNDNGRISMGDPRNNRFRAAKFRYVTDGFYIPLSEFADMGMQAFQSPRNIQQRYSQASGLAKFFMEYGGGKYRDALVEHLSQIYRGNPRRPAQSLPELTGVSYKELDRQYGAFIKALPVRVPPPRVNAGQ